MEKCKIIKRIDAVLCNYIPKYKLWRVSRAIGCKPYQWQRDYALGKTNHFGGGLGRATGKTMAVMLRILMMDVPDVKFEMFRQDPDWILNERYRVQWYLYEYRRLSRKCAEANIRVPKLSGGNGRW